VSHFRCALKEKQRFKNEDRKKKELSISQTIATAAAGRERLFQVTQFEM
jgi:hypothetical protein